MANTIKTTSSLKFEWAFADGDTRTFRIANPKYEYSDSDEENLETLNTLILENNLLIGDKAAGAFTGIYRVTSINETRNYLDLK